MHRHPGGEQHQQYPSNEKLPLMRHVSMQEQTSFSEDHTTPRHSLWLTQLRKSTQCSLLALILVLIAIFGLLFLNYGSKSPTFSSNSSRILPIERAVEYMLDVEDGISLWYRVWGNLDNGIPVLFVHGGPGNCIDDYDNGNKRFFDYKQFYVVEVDQRGTGRSEPSVRDDCRNIKYYKNITIDQMSIDYERVREALEIEKWLVFGGSWGSTLSLDYSERFPERTLGLIIRGVWLNTIAEFQSIFTQRVYQDNPKRLEEFNIWLEVAMEEARNAAEEELDPNDGERFFRLYQRLIDRCDKQAMWHWFVWENNMIEEDPANMFDPFEIDPRRLGEAVSIAFFENHLFLQGTYERPTRLLERAEHLKNTNTWICQGLRDEVCPTKFGALRLVEALVENKVPTRAKFLDGGHEDTDPALEQCLKEAVQDFLSTAKNNMVS